MDKILKNLLVGIGSIIFVCFIGITLINTSQNYVCAEPNSSSIPIIIIVICVIINIVLIWKR